MKLKKVLGVFASMTLVVGLLAACGEDDAGGADSNGNEESETIKIGVNLELSGPVASYGSSEADGIELAVEEINDAGGIDGKQIELEKVDNKSDTAEATSAAIKLTIRIKSLQLLGQQQVVRLLHRLRLQIAIKRL